MIASVATHPPLPTAGTGNDRFLRALLDAYPGAVWSPNDSLKIMAHSRAPELRRAGWDVRCVDRPAKPPAILEYGYVLRHDAATVDRAKRAVSPPRVLRFDDEFLPMAKVIERTGLDAGQLYWLHRHGHVPWDAEFHGSKQYAVSTVARLEAIGALARLGVQLQTAAEHVAHRRASLASDLRRAAASLEGVAS